MAGFTDKFSVRVKKERKKIKELKGFRKKAEYIWGYYKVPIVGVILFIAAAISIVLSIRSNNYETALNISYINCVSVDLRDDTHKLEELVEEWLGIDGVNTRVSIDGYYEIDPDNYSSDGYASYYRLMGLVTAKDSDCYISDSVFMNALAATDFFYDLEDLLPPELLEKASDRLLYYEDYEGNKQLFGIDLAGLPIITDVLVVGTQETIFSVVGNAPHTDAVITFLEHLLSYPD